MVQQALVPDAFIEPSGVNNVALLVVLHDFCLPDAWEKAVFLHHVVGTTVFAHHTPTILNNATPDTLHEVKSLTSLCEGVTEHGKGLLLENVLFYAILEPTLDHACLVTFG